MFLLWMGLLLGMCLAVTFPSNGRLFDIPLKILNFGDRITLY